MFTLYADRDGTRTLVETVSSFKAAARLVHKMEDAGSWPEGADAVLVGPNGTYYLEGDDGEGYLWVALEG